MTATKILWRYFSLFFLFQFFSYPAVATDYVEDFSSQTLMDISNTQANWSTTEQAAFLAWQKQRLHRLPGPNETASANVGDEDDATYSVAFADVDGDGDIDLVSGNNATTNKLYLNDGSGGFSSTGIHIGSETEASLSVTFADVDSDGDMDLVTGNAVVTNKLYLNDGSGGFSSTGINIGDETDYTFSIAVADVDNDGDMDLVSANFAATNKLYLNNGSGGFSSTGTDVGSETNSTRSIAFVDVDNDGDMDIVAGNSGQTNKLYLNNGSGTFSATGADIGSETEQTSSIAFVDVDSDGDMDMVAGNADKSNKLYLNDSNGIFSATGTNIGSETDDTRQIAFADIDNDGDIDIVAGNLTQTNKLYLNDGSGGFSAIGTTIGTETDNTYSIAFADVDGDGDMDMAAGNLAQINKLYLNAGSKGLAATGKSVGDEIDTTYSIAFADADGDGDIDIVAGNDGQTNKLYLNKGNGAFSAIGTTIGTETDNTYSIAFADVDGDGDMDVVAGNVGQTNKLYLNNGSGSFPATGSDIGSEIDTTRSIAFADVDGDGDIDFIAGNGGQTNKLYLNDGGGSFSATGLDIGNDTNNTFSVIIADVDADGDIDVISGNYNQTNKLYLNDGSGAFSTNGTNLGSEADATFSVAFADVDDDGDVDVVVGNNSQNNKLYLNNGSGSFSTNGTLVGNETDDTRSIAFGDVDGDGDIDVVAVNALQTNKLYLNNGNGSFSATATAIGGEADTTRSVGFADVDSDGDIDVVVGNVGVTNKLFLNTSSGGFSQTALNVGSDKNQTRTFAFADVDSDGDMDVVAGNYSQPNKLYFNDGNGGYSETGLNVGTETDKTWAIAFADVDSDGDMDIVTSSFDQTNKLYFNDGSGDFSATGTNIGSEVDTTYSVAFADVDGDGDVDMVAGNNGQTNKLYLNNGSGIFSATGTNIGSETVDTRSVAFADVDSDGDMDIVAGNYKKTNKLYLNDGSGIFSATGITIGSDSDDKDQTNSIAFADVDSDGDMDIVAGNFEQVNKLYFNDGSGTFSATGITIGNKLDPTRSILVADVDSDGDIDVIAGNDGETNKLYLNDGSGTFSDTGTNLGNETDRTLFIAAADVDGDGDIDVVSGNIVKINRLYKQQAFTTHLGVLASTKINGSETHIGSAKIVTTSTVNTTTTRNTHIDYYLTNNGGSKWYQVQENVDFTFPTAGTDDIRWKASLQSLSPVRTPVLSQVTVTTELANWAGSVTINDTTPTQGQTLTATVTDTDGVSGAISYQWQSNGSNVGTNSATYTTTQSDVGQAITVTATYIDDNSEAETPSSSATSTVVNVNDAPVITGIPDTNVAEDSAYNFTPSVTDVDSGDTATFSIINKPTWATFNTSTGALTGTPTNDDVGSTANIVITVKDTANVSASLAAFSLSVSNTNDAPVITGIPNTTVAENSVYNFTPSVTDVDSGDTATFSIVNKPTWATFNTTTGALTGTPTNDDVGSTANIVITVKDTANVSASLAAFSLSVSNTNDAPVITGIPNTTVAENSVYNFTPSVTDVDSGDTATFSIVNKPNWATFNTTTGALTGTPTNDDVGSTANIVITVVDSTNLNDSLPAFTLSVTNVNNAPMAVDDNFALTFNNTDTYALDVLANDTDIDDELLTISSASTSVGSVSIADGILIYSAQGNTQGDIELSYRIEDAEGASSQANVVLSVSQNNSAPVITVPADINALATGLFTKIDLGVATAIDSEGNTLAVSLVNNTQRFAPGKHIIYWRTQDNNGSETVASQTVNIQPLVSLSKDAKVGEENTSSFTVILNGPAPSYPVVVPYEVSGSADGNDHDVISGEVLINEGTQASVTFSTFGDGQNEGNEDIVITLTGDINLGTNNSTTITIVENNVAPAISTQVRQGNNIRTLVTKGGNDVVITANTSDVNPSDYVSVTWSSDNDNVVNVSNVDNEFVFSTADLASGIYKITVTASDDATPSLSTRQDVYVEVIDTLTTLTNADTDGDLRPDNTEGFDDEDNDGIPDYLDNITECNVLPAQAAITDKFLVEGDPGTCLRKGKTVAQNKSGGAKIFTDELQSDNTALNIGGLFDFIATDLPKAGDIYGITIPQRLPIPSDAIYRKLIDDEWVDFVEDNNNTIYSAPGNAGFCPPPGNDEWTSGLNEGDWCVLLNIEDGGPNDDDGEKNQIIIERGGVAVLLSDNILPQINSDSVEINVNQTITLDVLANDTDANDDILTISSASVDFGHVAITDNQLTYTPPADFVGLANIAYSVTDGQGGTGASTLTVDVTINQAPTVNDDSASTNNRTAINIDVLANDSDIDGDTLTVINVSANQGFVNINSDGSLLYTPSGIFEGTDVITYEVSDGQQGISSGQVFVNVETFKAAAIENRSSGGSINAMWLLLLSIITCKRWYLNARCA